MRPLVVDHLDRQLLHALTINGRASFSQLADVLGTSDQTAARRYRRLRDADAARVLGLVDPIALGEVDWVLRLTCVPEAADPFARALAKRSDTSWVQLASGGTEILCGARARRDPGQDTLLGRLASTRRVLAISAHCVLHRFSGGPAPWPGVTHALTEDQIARLTPPTPQPVPARPVELDSDDRALLDALARDGRAPNTALAAVTGWHESTIRRRVEQLRAAGILYFDLDFDEHQLGYHAVTALWLSVAPDQVSAVGQALSEHDQIVFAAATTGPTNVFAAVLCQDMYALHTYLTTEIARLPAIRRIESMPIMRTLKRAGSLPDP